MSNDTRLSEPGVGSLFASFCQLPCFGGGLDRGSRASASGRKSRDRAETPMSPFQKIEASMVTRWKESNRSSFELVAQRIHGMLEAYPLVDRPPTSREEVFEALWSFVEEHEQCGLLTDVMLRRLILYKHLDPKGITIASSDQMRASWLSRVPPPPSGVEWTFEQLFKEVEGAEPFMFVDIGCGLGNACVAAMRHPFAAVVGVEVDPETAEACRRNLEIVQGHESTKCAEAVVCNHADLESFEFKGVPTVLFLHGPAAEQEAERAAEMVRTVLQRGRASVAYVLYVERGEAWREKLSLDAIESCGFARLQTGLRRHVTGVVSLHLFRTRERFGAIGAKERKTTASSNSLLAALGAKR